MNSNISNLIIILGFAYNVNAAYDLCTSQSSQSNSKVVQTLNGGVRGECYNVPVSYSNGSTIDYDVYSWLGIPFAEPPTGSNRFLAPKPVKSWSETKDALNWPKKCLQIGVTDGSEDCLYLNVFVRGDTYLNKANELKAVMVWIHGGGFAYGSSSEDYYEPSTLVSSQDIIFVSIQYRLDVYGFLGLENSQATGNAGLLDQTMAFKWIFDNIKNFGGDNSRITIFGQSAGSWSVGFHLFYPGSWPYFTNAILESGAPGGENNQYRLRTFSEATINSRNYLINKLNCTDATNEQLLECAQNKSSLEVSDAAIFGGYNRPLFDRPNIDNIVFKKSIDELAADETFKKCNIISGFTTNEIGLILNGIISLLNYDPYNFTYNNYENLLKIMFVTYKVTDGLIEGINKEYLNAKDPLTLNQTDVDYLETLLRLETDNFFQCNSFNLNEIYSKKGLNLKAYMYEYSKRIENTKSDPIYGQVLHGDELPVIFAETMSNKKSPITSYNPWSALDYNYSLESKKFTEKFINLWTNFAKYNDPNYLKSSEDSDYWHPFANSSLDFENLTGKQKMDSANYYLITNTSMKTVSGDFSKNRCDFWNYTRDGLLRGNSGYKLENNMLILFSISTVFIKMVS